MNEIVDKIHNNIGFLLPDRRPHAFGPLLPIVLDADLLSNDQYVSSPKRTVISVDVPSSQRQALILLSDQSCPLLPSPGTLNGLLTIYRKRHSLGFTPFQPDRGNYS